MKATKMINTKHIVLISTLVQLLLANSAFASSDRAIAHRTAIGNPCASTSDCQGEGLHCVEAKETGSGVVFSGGYCVKFDCSELAPCDVGSTCVQTQGTDYNVCLASCTTDSHCRNGYACHEAGVCLPQ